MTETIAAVMPNRVEVRRVWNAGVQLVPPPDMDARGVLVGWDDLVAAVAELDEVSPAVGPSLPWAERGTQCARCVHRVATVYDRSSPLCAKCAEEAVRS